MSSSSGLKVAGWPERRVNLMWLAVVAASAVSAAGGGRIRGLAGAVRDLSRRRALTLARRRRRDALVVDAVAAVADPFHPWEAAVRGSHRHRFGISSRWWPP
jgi:hypothetical protein